MIRASTLVQVDTGLCSWTPLGRGLGLGVHGSVPCHHRRLGRVGVPVPVPIREWQPPLVVGTPLVSVKTGISPRGHCLDWFSLSPKPRALPVPPTASVCPAGTVTAPPTSFSFSRTPAFQSVGGARDLNYQACEKISTHPEVSSFAPWIGGAGNPTWVQIAPVDVDCFIPEWVKPIS